MGKEEEKNLFALFLCLVVVVDDVAVVARRARARSRGRASAVVSCKASTGNNRALPALIKGT